jgi:HEAT repeat protein
VAPALAAWLGGAAAADDPFLAAGSTTVTARAAEDAAAPAPRPAGPGAGAAAPDERAKAAVEAVRAAASPPGTLPDRAHRVAERGAEAIAVLATDLSLAALADEVLPVAIAAATEREIAAWCERLLEGDGAAMAALVPRIPSPPRAALVGPLARFLDAKVDAPAPMARARLLLAEGALEAGPSAFEGALYGPAAVSGAARASLVEAIEAGGRPDAAALLAAIVGERGPIGVAAANALARCPDPGGEGVDALVLALGAEEPMLRQAAARALGALRASEAIDALIEALAPVEASRGPDAGLGAAARPEPHGASPAPPPPGPLPRGARLVTPHGEVQRALVEITGIRGEAPTDAAGWRAAVEEGRRAADEALPVLLAEVASGDPAVAYGAARALAGHAVRRDRIRPTLLRVLASGDPEARATAAMTLGALRDAAAAAPLVDALSDPDPGVWQAAHTALRRATGLDLPARPDAWRRRGIARLERLAREEGGSDSGARSDTIRGP